MPCGCDMGKYDGYPCPVCGKAFSHTDDIVVCPVCGLPHHRSCWLETGHCAKEDKHGTDEAGWHPEKEQNFQYNGRQECKCPRCGVENPVDAIFCQICGTPMRDNMEPPGRRNPPSDFAGAPPFYTIPEDPINSPFAGLNPEEEIRGITVKEYTLFLGQNAHWFLPKFREMARSDRKMSWNWGIFFFEGFYFLFRKEYLLAILSFVVQTLLSIPSLIIMIKAMTVMLLEPELAQGLQMDAAQQWEILDLPIWLGGLQSICGILIYAFRFLQAMFGNRLYLEHCAHKIHKIRLLNLPERPYIEMLCKKGGTNKTIILVLVGSYIFLIFAMNFLAMLIPVLYQS